MRRIVKKNDSNCRVHGYHSQFQRTLSNRIEDPKAARYFPTLLTLSKMDGKAFPKLYGSLAAYDEYFQLLLAQIVALEKTWPVQLVNKYLSRAEKDLPISKQVFNPGPDPRTEKWPLATPGLPVLIVLGYIALVLILKPVVSALLPKLKLRGAVLIHNIFAAGMSAYMVYESYMTFDEIYGAKSLLTSSRWSHEIDNIDTDRTNWSTVAAHRLASILFVHYIMKIYELADTFIMVFKQNWRQVSFLHMYHHASGKPAVALPAPHGLESATLL